MGGYLRDWDRTLRSAGHPETTRYNYLLAAAQLARFLEEFSPDPDADEAAQDPCAVTRAHVEAFQAWMIETRSASTALNKHKGLQQFFRWLQRNEGDIDRSPMERVAQPRTPQKLIPLLSAEETSTLLQTCRDREFERVLHPHEELGEREAVEPEIAVERAVERCGRRALRGTTLGNEVADGVRATRPHRPARPRAQRRISAGTSLNPAVPRRARRPADP